MSTARWLQILCYAAGAILLCGCGKTSLDELPERRSDQPQPAPLALQTTARVSDGVAGVLPGYQRISGISGALTSTGSDTLANLMTLWSEAFKREYPSVNIQVQAAGSSTAPPALIEGTANFGPMSRPLKDNESEAFELRHGYKPLAIRVAIDAVAIYTHKDNPIDSVSIEALDAAFSVTRRCGGLNDVRTWGDLGLQGNWSNRPLQLYGRNSVSGTYGYFKTVALCAGDYKSSVNEQPGSASVVQAVASSRNGIGYSGIGYATPGVKALAVRQGRANPVRANPETASDGRYPLSRFFFIYVNKPPNEPLAPLEGEFIKFVLSQAGQAIVRQDGYIPISAQIANREIAKID